MDGEAREHVKSLDVFPYLAESDFVKMDIEGSEWQLIADRRFADVPAAVLVVEWHSEGCPYPGGGGRDGSSARRGRVSDSTRLD